MKKILAVTSSRSDYDLLFPLLKKLDKVKNLELNLLCCGSHLNKDFGRTISEIKKDNFKKILKLNTIEGKIKNNLKFSMANSFSKLFLYVLKLIKVKKINLILLLGDRYESFSVASCGYLAKVKIAHISGGDTSFGAMDEKFRNMISSMSNLHFVKTKEHQLKLLKLGIEDKSIFITGSLSNENYIKKFEKKFFIQKPFILVTFHPVTNIFDIKSDNKIEILLRSLKKIKSFNILFTASNHDPRGEKINKKIKEFVKLNKNAYFVPSLGRKLYFQAMKECEFMIGNSSSGIIESMIYKKPSINILPRQMGRQSGKNVIHCKMNQLKIDSSIKKALSKKFKRECLKMKNIFSNEQYKPSDIMLKHIKKCIKV